MSETLPLWVIEIMFILFIPLAFAITKGKFAGSLVIPSLAMTLIFGIWTGVLPDHVIILPIVIIALMLFGITGTGSDTSE